MHGRQSKMRLANVLAVFSRLKIGEMHVRSLRWLHADAVATIATIATIATVAKWAKKP